MYMHSSEKKLLKTMYALSAERRAVRTIKHLICLNRLCSTDVATEMHNN